MQHGAGAEQHDRNGDRWDQGRAEVLKKEVHDEEDEDDRDAERFDDFLDGKLNERRCVVGVDDVDPRREVGAEALDGGADGFDGLERGWRRWRV